MNNYKISAVLVIMLVLVLSCSRKQEEASQLEQEMLSEDSTALTERAESTGTDSHATSTGAGAIPVEDEPATDLPVAEESGYVVQVAACESSEYARYLTEKYLARGYDPYLTTTTEAGQTYYRVRIGGLETMQQAKALKAELVDKYSVDVWIDKTD